MSSVSSTMAVLTALKFGKKKNHSSSKQLKKPKEKVGSKPRLEFMLEADEFIKNVKVEHNFPKRKTNFKK